MAAQVPASDSGTVMPAASVGVVRRRNTNTTIMTSAMASSSVNCMSWTLARIVVVRSVSTWMSMPAGIQRCRLGMQRLHLVDRVEDVGVGLLADDQQHRRLVVEHGGRARVARAVLDAGDARQAHDVAVARLQYDGAVVLGGAQLRVGVDGDRLLVAVDGADRRHGVGLGDGAAHLLHAEAHGGEQRRVDAHANGRLLGAADLHLRDARHLRDALGDDGVGGVVDGARRQALRRHGEDEHRRRRRIVLAECRHVRKVAGQIGGGGVQRRLHVAGGAVDVARQVELHRDAGRALRAHRGQLGDAGDLAQPLLDRRGDGRRHGLRIGARAGSPECAGSGNRPPAGSPPAARNTPSRRAGTGRPPAAPFRWVAG